MPDAVANPASAFQGAHFINKLLHRGVAEAAIDVIVVSPANAARISPRR